MSELSIGPAETSELQKVIDAGKIQLQEIQDIRESLRDTVKAIAEKLNMKPKEIMDSIRVAFKANLAEKNTHHETVCAILEATKRG
jgi:division protein CdvB (Snf7/Vps24/ESCRT-III family)